MQISVEKTEGLGRRMTVELPAERVEDAVKKRLMSLARTAKVAGFRPGKVPMRIMENKYGPQVRGEVISEAVQSSLHEALVKEQLNPADFPNVELMPLEPGKGPKYTATFEIYPEVAVTDLDGVEVERPSAEVTDEDVEKTLDVIRMQNMEYLPVDREARDGDQVVVDFKGSVDGAAFAGGEGKDVPIVLGAKRFIADFETNLVGVKAGETKTIDATFPEDYGNKDLAGKTAQFEVTVGSVNAPELPELDDAFAARFGVTDGGIDALKQEVRLNMQREMEQVVKESVKRQVSDVLVERHEVSLPKVMVDKEIQRLIEQTRRAMGQNRDVPLAPDLFREQAERRVVLGLVMAEIMKQNQLKVDAERVRTAVENIAASYEHPEEVIAWYYADRSRLADIEAMVMEDAVIDWVLGRATLTEKPTTFDELVRPAQKQDELKDN